MRKFYFIFLVFFVFTSVYSYAQEDSETETSLYQSVKNHFCNIWNSDQYEFLFPINTYHSPLTYSKEKRKDYNERPWGFGIGKYIEPTPNRRYALAFMTFQDSFNKPEPSFFYSWQHLWRAGKDFRPTVGFMAGITFRDNYHWIPVPGAAPTIGFEYKSFAIDTLYVPGFDVFLTWLTWHF